MTKTLGQRQSPYWRVVATEPQAIRRRDTHNPPAAAGPAPRIDDTAKWQAGPQLIGKETEGYLRSSRVLTGDRKGLIGNTSVVRDRTPLEAPRT